MGNAIRRIAVIFAAAAAVTALGGCMDYRALNQQTIVAGIAVDLNSRDDGFSFTFEIINTAGMDLNDGMGSGLVKVDAATFSEAIAEADNTIHNKLLLINTEIVVIGEEAAKTAGLAWLITEFFANFRIRDTAAIAVSRGCRAEELLHSSGTGERHIVSYEIYRHLKEGQPGISTAHIVRVYELLNDLEREDRSGILLPVFSLEGDGPPIPGGLAVFGKDKLAGFIDERYTQSVMQASQQIRTGSYFTVPGEAGGAITLIINSVASKHSYYFDGDKISFYIDISVQADVVAPPVLAADNANASTQSIGKLAEKHLTENLQYVYRTMVERHGVDSLGLSRTIYQKDPGLWKSLKADWENTLTKSVLVVRPVFKIRGDGILT